MLTMVLTKLQAAAAGSRLRNIQAMIQVFARLIDIDMGAVVSFLAEKDALAMVLSLWLENTSSFTFKYDINVSTKALSTLFLSKDARLLAIPVPGDAPAEEGRRTRSQGPSPRPMITAYAKIFKMLIWQYREVLDEEQYLDDDDDDEDSDDDEVDLTGRPSPFAPAEDFEGLLSEGGLIDLGAKGWLENDDDCIETDQDKLDDPLYSLDQKAHLLEVFRAAAADEEAKAHLMPALNPGEQKILMKALS